MREQHTRTFVLDAETATNQRLDVFLAKQLPEHSRSEIQRWIKDKRVQLTTPAGKALAAPAPSFRLRDPLTITFDIPEERQVQLLPEAIGIDVVFEDDAIIVVNKHAGLVVHPSPGHSGGTLVNALLYRGGPLATGDDPDRPGLVHRLDRDTSGIMVIARTNAAQRDLQRQFHDREVSKSYIAMVEGKPRYENFEVDARIGRSPRDRKKMAICDDGREAYTRFEVAERWGRLALVRCFPRTGRTHQLRVHLKSLHYPILCDSAYGRSSSITAAELEALAKDQSHHKARASGGEPLLARQALHAHSLAFTHPVTGAPVSFEAPMPVDLQAVAELARKIIDTHDWVSPGLP